MLISNLQIGAEIGSGHFGKVHIGTDDIHGTVAVKVLTKTTLETSAEWQARRQGLLNEGQLLSRAEHSNVLKVHGSLESTISDAIHLVMDYCPTGCLQKLVDAGPMDLADVRRYVTQATMGLSALHARSMLHRDIKPANILLNKKDVAQLGDFGLVTDDIVLGYADASGYNDHLPVEVHNGEGTSEKSDIWAMGMTIYRMLHGSELYLRMPKPRYVIGKGGFAKGLPFLPHIPKAWRTVVRTMMHDDKSRRIPTASAALTAYSKLHTTPRWHCSVAADRISWRATIRSRLYFVDWDMPASGLNNWSAWSEPVGKGNRRNFGAANGIPYADANKQLTSLFEKIKG